MIELTNLLESINRVFFASAAVTFLGAAVYLCFAYISFAKAGERQARRLADDYLEQTGILLPVSEEVAVYGVSRGKFGLSVGMLPVLLIVAAVFYSPENSAATTFIISVVLAVGLIVNLLCCLALYWEASDKWYHDFSRYQTRLQETKVLWEQPLELTSSSGELLDLTELHRK